MSAWLFAVAVVERDDHPALDAGGRACSAQAGTLTLPFAGTSTKSPVDCAGA